MVSIMLYTRTKNEIHNKKKIKVNAVHDKKQLSSLYWKFAIR